MGQAIAPAGRLPERVRCTAWLLYTIPVGRVSLALPVSGVQHVRCVEDACKASLMMRSMYFLSLRGRCHGEQGLDGRALGWA
ncbi:hypothetical protein B0H65DRAFT_468075 [Neurospora tetraspora]|uniref:Uncharacterized protein n=1 Tax=Neurospora tetraspora TaxID=94610 RepID=A0AAE0JCL0_9PEZI|nr:hypothetical protein B0H65DRAFT_468075 [Neurospora tetraspora]